MSEHDRRGGSGDPEDEAEGGVEAEIRIEDFSATLQPVPRVMSVFPLQNTVLFPRTSLPLHIFEGRYKAMIADVLEQDRALAIALTDDEDGELGAREICAAGVVTRVEHLEDGEKNIVVTGGFRARIAEVIEHRPYIVARVLPIADEGADAKGLAAAHRQLRDLAMQWVFFKDDDSSQEMLGRLALIRTPAELADWMAFHLFDDPALKQEILETPEVARRVARVSTLAQAALEKTRAGK